MLALGKLYSFVKVVECGSFTKAAIMLDTAHSGLSRQVIELERDIGYRILQRTGRGVRLTEPGKLLFERAKHLIAAANAFEDEARAMRGVPIGTVNIGMPGSIASLLGSRLLIVASRKYPEVKIRLIEGLSGSIEEMLATGRVDFALFFATPNGRARAGNPLFCSDLYLVGSTQDELVRSDTVEFSKLAGLRLILPGMPHAIRHAVGRACAAAGIEVNVPYEADSLSTMKRAVEDGAGYTVTSWDSVQREVSAGLLRAAKIVRPVLTRELALECSPLQPMTIAARVILEQAKELTLELLANQAWRLRAAS